MIKKIIDVFLTWYHNVFRNSQTVLTDQERAYCEHDCLVVLNMVNNEANTVKGDLIP